MSTVSRKLRRCCAQVLRCRIHCAHWGNETLCLCPSALTAAHLWKCANKLELVTSAGRLFQFLEVGGKNEYWNTLRGIVLVLALYVGLGGKFYSLLPVSVDYVTLSGREILRAFLVLRFGRWDLSSKSLTEAIILPEDNRFVLFLAY